MARICIYPHVQKAFINGINGCVEHNQVLHEIISHSKTTKRTVHVTFFDLADAFGSVSHELISHSLRRFHVPNNLSVYIENLYGRLQGVVKCKKWSSETFMFKKGVFQGDPLSPIIFLSCFNPLIEYLSQMKDSQGYDLNGTRIITTPYADDFNLITNNKVQHQKIIDKLHSYTSTMGLKLKPSKCCSLSICGGAPKEIKYSIGNECIRSIKEKPHKFLGSLICFSGKPSEVCDFVESDILAKLQRIDELQVRPEFKVAIYSRYLLNSIRFLLTVHTLQKTHLDKLDVLTDKYLKSWLGVPSRGANVAIVHLPQGLNIPRLSDIYRQSQSLAYSRSRVKADAVVNQAIDSAIERESQWSRKQSTYVQCKVTHSKVETLIDVQTSSWQTVKKTVKHVIEEDIVKYWSDRITPLLVQGKFTSLLLLENENLTWKSIIYNLPKRVLSFIVNACIDSLPSYTNLHTWGKRLSDKCIFCPGTTGTLHHILSNCPIFLDRYEWRHNNILRYMHKTFFENMVNGNMYSDLEGHSVAGGTIPPHILTTNLRPDLVIVREEDKQISIIELTVPFETNVENAHQRKVEKYSSLVRDIQDNGYTVSFYAIEIGVRGLVDRNNKRHLKRILKTCNSNIRPNEFFQTLSKLAILSSFTIFYSRKERAWGEVRHLDP